VLGFALWCSYCFPVFCVVSVGCLRPLYGRRPCQNQDTRISIVLYSHHVRHDFYALNTNINTARQTNPNTNITTTPDKHATQFSTFHSKNFPTEFSSLKMVKLPKIPNTPEDFNDVSSYLRSGTFAAKYDTPTKRANFQRRCKNFLYDRQKGHLLYIQPPKDENSRPIFKRVVPAYDTELRAALFEKFHVGTAHFEYHKTYTMLFEQHIGITQDEVKKYVRNCSTCIRNTSIKEKADLTPVVANGPLEHVQVDLVDFLSFAEYNDGYSYILTMIDVFSRYVWAIPLQDKEGSTIHRELVKVFMSFGPPSKL